MNRQLFRIAASLLLLGIACLDQPHAQLTLTGVGGGFGAGGSFTPASLSNLFIWLDATQKTFTDTGCTTPTTNGTTVGCWKDNSANAFAFTQATAGARPTWNTTGFNAAHNGITFVAANSQALGIASASVTASQMSVFLVIVSTDAASSNDGLITLLGSGQANDFSNASSFVIDDVGAASTNFRFSSAAYDDTTVTGSYNTPVSLGVIFDGTNGTAYKNFAASTPAAAASRSFGNTTASIQLGCRQLSSCQSPFFDGVLAEVVVTTGTMSGTDLSNLHSYWQTKWGVP